MVPIDFSETSMLALEHAQFLAKKINAEITLIHVHETNSFSNPLKSLLFKGSSDKKTIDESVEKQLNDLAEKTRKEVTNVNVVFKNEDAKVYKQIVDAATQLGSQLIIMGARGTKAGDKSSGGANAFRVVASAPCPVITLNKDSGKKGIKNIVLPIDTSRETREKVDEAIYMAQLFDSTIHICAVTSSDDEVVYNHLKKVSQQVQTFIEKDKISCTNDFFPKANITNSTLALAKKVEADLIIIMTEQETTSLFMGPYAQQMINQSEFPVLSIRPKEKDTEFVRPY